MNGRILSVLPTHMSQAPSTIVLVVVSVWGLHEAEAKTGLDMQETY